MTGDAMIKATLTVGPRLDTTSRMSLLTLHAKQALAAATATATADTRLQYDVTTLSPSNEQQPAAVVTRACTTGSKSVYNERKEIGLEQPGKTAAAAVCGDAGEGCSHDGD